MITMEEMKKEYFKYALHRAKGNVALAARSIGISYRGAQIYCRMLGIKNERRTLPERINNVEVKLSPTQIDELVNSGNYPKYFDCMNNLTPEERDTIYNRDSFFN